MSKARGGIEIAFIFFVMLFMLALHQAVEKGERSRYLVAGALLGVVVMFAGLATGVSGVPARLLPPDGDDRRRAAAVDAEHRCPDTGDRRGHGPIGSPELPAGGTAGADRDCSGTSAQEGQFACQRLAPGPGNSSNCRTQRRWRATKWPVGLAVRSRAITSSISTLSATR